MLLRLPLPRFRPDLSPARLKTLPWLRWAKMAALLGMAAFYLYWLGTFIAWGALVFALLLAAVPLALFGYWLLMRADVRRDSDWLFWLLLALIFILPLVHKSTGRAFYFVLELLLLFLFPLMLPSMLRAARTSRVLRFAAGVFAAFAVVSLLATAYGRSTFLAALYQFVTNLKVLWVLALGFYLTWSDRTGERFWWFMRWLWLPIALMLCWQYLHPSTFFGLFGKADPNGIFPTGIHFDKGYGPFQHPSFLAMYAAIFGLFVLAKGLIDRDWAYAVPVLAYAGLLFCSQERQELAGYLMAVLALFIMTRPHGRRLPALAMTAFLAAGLGMVFWLLYGEQLIDEGYTWGLAGHEDVTHPRPVMYRFAEMIAAQYFPLGSGLGTFAGAGAQKYDLSYYFELGYTRYSWFLEKDVLMDTYWPNYIAETGWLGLGLHALFFFILMAYAGIATLRASVPVVRMYWSMAFIGLLFLFLLSPTSPSFQDPGLSLLPLMFWGIAFHKAQRR